MYLHKANDGDNLNNGEEELGLTVALDPKEIYHNNEDQKYGYEY